MWSRAVMPSLRRGLVALSQQCGGRGPSTEGQPVLKTWTFLSLLLFLTEAKK